MIEKILIISLLVYAIHYTMLPGEIFAKVGNWLHQHLPPRLQEPVFECPVCMVPWYGSALYWIIWAGSWQEGFVVVFAAMGLNSIINPIINKE